MLSKCYAYAIFALAAMQFSSAQVLDWSIAFVEGSTSAVTDSEDVEIIQSYIIGNDQSVVVEVMDYSCTTVDDTGLFTPTKTTAAETDGDKYNLDVTVDVSEDKIMGSSYWTPDTGLLKLCVKVQLMHETESVSFYETQVELTIEMTVDFDDTVHVTKLIPTTETTATDLWYDINACLCGGHEDTTCLESPTIMQNELFNLCMTPVEPEIEIEEVLDVALVQDGIVKSDPVAAKTADALSTLRTSGTTHVLTTWSLSSFFSVDTPTPVTAQGTLKLKFVTAPAARRLRIKDQNGRILSRILTSDTASFQVELELGYDPEYANADSPGARMVAGIFSVFACLLVSYMSI